jgi:L-methionine (R)-S-oxide reductase
MASIVTVLHHEMADFYWTGFYRVIDGGLVIGPYQGTVGCLRIAFGKGVCGTAAQTEETQVVPDVHRFPGHISCDARSKSEIVVPVRNREGDLIGVLDIDSEEKGTFDDVDREALEGILKTIWQG